MPVLGSESHRQLVTCHPDLIRVAERAITYVDFTILEGHRDEAHQNADYAKGVSKLKWPNGRHNRMPSDAFDFAPYPIDWSEKAVALGRFMLVSGVMLVCAAELGVKIRFGWDWNRNLDPRDESFLDWGHVERDLGV
jgi:peptidoglycan L-alanyl-D-glutamate endopeptidase CwlK